MNRIDDTYGPSQTDSNGLLAATPTASIALTWTAASLGRLPRPTNLRRDRAGHCVAEPHALPPAPEGSRDAAYNSHAQLEHTWLERATVHDRAQIRQFLRHLENNGSSWAALVPSPDDRRPLDLERAVNDAIARHGVDKSARGSINRMFGLELRGPSGRAPIRRWRPTPGGEEA